MFDNYFNDLSVGQACRRRGRFRPRLRQRPMGKARRTARREDFILSIQSDALEVAKQNLEQLPTTVYSHSRGVDDDSHSMTASMRFRLLASACFITFRTPKPGLRACVAKAKTRCAVSRFISITGSTIKPGMVPSRLES